MNFICRLLFPALAVTVNVRSTAIFAPPAAALMSKFVSTVVPLMATLNSRCPLAARPRDERPYPAGNRFSFLYRPKCGCRRIVVTQFPGESPTSEVSSRLP